MKKILLISLLLSSLLQTGYTQKLATPTIFLGGKYKIHETRFDGVHFKIYDFIRGDLNIRVKYFAKNAYSEFLTLKSQHRILLVCSGAFSNSFESHGYPVGLTIDKGEVINRNLKPDMDGLVIVYNEGKETGKLFTLDIERELLGVEQPNGKHKRFDLEKYSERYQFIKHAEKDRMTVFQTQLMFSNQQVRFPNNNLYYGKSATRRFLVKALRNGIERELIVDISKDELHLNKAAKQVISLLKLNNFKIEFILNLDTGGKDILSCYNEKGRVIQASRYPIQKATNLLVYYYGN